MYKYSTLRCQIVSIRFTKTLVCMLVRLSVEFFATCMYFPEKLAYASAAFLSEKFLRRDSAMVSPQTEKRSSPRKPMNVRAKVHTGQGDIPAEALNLSQSGIFLECATRVSEGSPVDIVMILPKEITGEAAKWVCCRATVNRVQNSAADGRYGVAATV